MPRKWTDYYLPLAITQNNQAADAHIERVMIGRIELICPTQRALLDRLASADIANNRWISDIPESESRERFLAGRSNFGNLGVTIPPDYQMYLDLGRFRNALVVAEEAAHRTDSLARFIDMYQLHPYRWTNVDGELKSAPQP